MIWTAVGAIATAVAVIVALIANYRTNKNNEENRKLQIALLRQQRAQKKLDEMVQNVIQLNKMMSPRDIQRYSSRFVEEKFTQEDCSYLEALAVDDESMMTKIRVLDAVWKGASLSSVLTCLRELREDYGLWSRSVTTTFQYKKDYKGFGARYFGEDVVPRIVREMLDKYVARDPANSDFAKRVLADESNFYEKAKSVLKEFGPAMAKCIQCQKNKLEKALQEVVCMEQKRIDDIVA